VTTETRAVPQYTYRAPSGVWVTSCRPPQADPWLRFGVVGYGFCSYRHLRKVVRKQRQRERRERRERREQRAKKS
jgi:hypothetical protein